MGWPGELLLEERCLILYWEDDVTILIRRNKKTQIEAIYKYNFPVNPALHPGTKEENIETLEKMQKIQLYDFLGESMIKNQKNPV